MRYRFSRWAAAAATLVALSAWPAAAEPVTASATGPNVVYMMLDEIGYFELSSMGHPVLSTPNVDRLAQQGMRFTQCLAGAPVCAPTRCALLTGKHMGHAQVRTNGGGAAITRDEVTLGEMFKAAGYATGGFGKWGIGDAGTTGVPELHGFDIFYGYYHQVHAHSYYPRYLIRNGEREKLPGNPGGQRPGKTFSQYRIHEEALRFIRDNHDRPFFCYLPYTPPHGRWAMPDHDPSWLEYKDMKLGGRVEARSTDANMYAAMVHLADRQLGEVLALLQELGIEDNTIVVFSGDNGGMAYFKDAEHPRGVFEPNSTVYRGGKRELLEGGLRVPYIVRWPGKVAAGAVTDHLCYFPDVMPTLAEACGAETPADIDGVSFLQTLLGEGVQEQHEFLYWEYSGQTAVRQDKWKAYKRGPKAAWRLFDLEADSYETNDLAASHPEKLRELIAFASGARTEPVTGTWIDKSKRFVRAK